MRRKLTITIDHDVYAGLYERIGPRRIAKFIEDLVRPHVLDLDLESAYADMAADEEHEADAADWADSLICDVGDETR